MKLYFLTFIFILFIPFACSDDGNETPKTCQGEPTQCTYLTEAQCYFQDGCSVFDDCSGYVWSCFILNDSTTCTNQMGCSWTSSSSSCTGVAWECDTIGTQSACSQQQGCTFRRVCDGYEHSCDSYLTESTCLQQQGCLWE
jgi:hypothetical protein